MIDNDQWDAFLEAYEELNQKYVRLTEFLVSLVYDGEHEDEVLDKIKDFLQGITNG